jgi:hypothetical protein
MRTKILGSFTQVKFISIILAILASNFVQPFTPTSSAVIPTGSLLLDLRANSSSSFPGSGSTWFDLSGYSNDATLQSTPTWSSTLGGSFALNGTDHFSLPSGFSNFSSGLTVSLYANFGSNTGAGFWERLFDFGNGPGSNNILFARSGTSADLAFEIYAAGPSKGKCTWTGGILSNTWATYAVTLNGTNCVIYRDGISRYTQSYTALPNNVNRTSNYIARSNWNADAYFDTGIAAMALYNRALSASEVAELSLGQKDSTPPTITGPASATGANSSISIPENSTAVHTFTANESVTWSKSGSDETFFSIASNGVLTITSRDFESPADNGGNNTYIVTITATDGASNATTQTLTVTITNINEAPTITTASSAATYAITQPENISSVVTYAATDIDVGSSLTFSISGTDAADFSIDSSTGLLEFVANPDFEAPADGDTNNTYVVVITVSDGSLSDTQELTVTITNVNENSNIGAPTVSGTINKGISITITVTSDVAGKVRFFVGGKRITKCLARSTAGSYPSFSATCSWKPPVTGRHNLTARIAPTNNSYSASTSAATSVWVNRRTNSR